MNKNIWISIVVLVVIIVLSWIMFSYKNDSSSENATTEPLNATTSNSTSQTPKAVSTTKSANTFPTIFAQAGSHKCTFEQVDQSSRSTNIIYIADGKMRGEFRTTSSGKSTGSMMVYNNGTLYVWQEGASTGVRTVLKSVSDLPMIIPKDLTSGTVIGSGLNSVGWDCHDWSKDSTLLSPPSYVKF